MKNTRHKNEMPSGFKLGGEHMFAPLSSRFLFVLPNKYREHFADGLQKEILRHGERQPF